MAEIIDFTNKKTDKFFKAEDIGEKIKEQIESLLEELGLDREAPARASVFIEIGDYIIHLFVGTDKIGAFLLAEEAKLRSMT